jgi:hypothetical protein
VRRKEVPKNGKPHHPGCQCRLGTRDDYRALGLSGRLFCDGYRQYRIEVSLGSDGEIADVLSTLERYVTERRSGPARIARNGHEYTMQPDASPREIIATPN